MPHVAIVGAGCAGLAAAWSLARAGHQCTVFEKSRGFSGRAATRRRGDSCYDHGANFFRTEDPEIHDLIHRQLPTNELVSIPGPVWTFDHDSRTTPGDEQQNALPKFTYRQGISTLGKLLGTAGVYWRISFQTSAQASGRAPYSDRKRRRFNVDRLYLLCPATSSPN